MPRGGSFAERSPLARRQNACTCRRIGQGEHYSIVAGSGRWVLDRSRGLVTCHIFLSCPGGSGFGGEYDDRRNAFPAMIASSGQETIVEVVIDLAIDGSDLVSVKGFDINVRVRRVLSSQPSVKVRIGLVSIVRCTLRSNRVCVRVCWGGGGGEESNCARRGSRSLGSRLRCSFLSPRTRLRCK